jgi:hypothetical protein
VLQPNKPTASASTSSKRSAPGQRKGVAPSPMRKTLEKTAKKSKAQPRPNPNPIPTAKRKPARKSPRRSAG